MERDSRPPRASRPFSVRMMAERRPGFGEEPARASGNGRTEPPPEPDPVDPPDSPAESPFFTPPPPPIATPGTSRDPRDPVFIVRESGEILFANRALGEQSEDEVIGSSIFDWVPPDQHAIITETLAKVFHQGEPARHELAGLQDHEPHAWYDCRITPNVRDGKVVSATMVAHDITDYRRQIQELEGTTRELQRLLEERTADLAQASARLAEAARTRDKEERHWHRFRQLMDQAGEAVFITDPRTEKVIDLNETAARWIGKTREEAIGRRPHDLRIEFPLQPPVEFELELTETRDTRRPLLLDGVHRRRDGSTFPVEVAVARHQLGSEEVMLAVARDVKARRASEAALTEARDSYRSLFEQCWDAIYLTARGGEVEAVNGAAIELFGYPTDAFVGLDARKLFSRQQDIRRFQVQMNTMGAVGDLEVELITKDGSTFQALLSATRRSATEGGIRGYQCIVRPITLPPALQENGEGGVRARGTVIVADSSAAASDARNALAAAGMRVLAAETAGAAVQLVREHASVATAIVFDTDAVGAALRDTLEEVRRHAPTARLILLTAQDPIIVAEGVADLRIQGILRKPVLPLALIQKIRDV